MGLSVLGSKVTITEELETHPIFAQFLRQCALMSIGKWDPEAYYNQPVGMVREPMTGVWVYTGAEERVYEVGP